MLFPSSETYDWWICSWHFRYLWSKIIKNGFFLDIFLLEWVVQLIFTLKRGIFFRKVILNQTLLHNATVFFNRLLWRNNNFRHRIHHLITKIWSKLKFLWGTLLKFPFRAIPISFFHSIIETYSDRSQIQIHMKNTTLQFFSLNSEHFPRIIFVFHDTYFNFAVELWLSSLQYKKLNHTLLLSYRYHCVPLDRCIGNS